MSIGTKVLHLKRLIHNHGPNFAVLLSVDVASVFLRGPGTPPSSASRRRCLCGPLSVFYPRCTEKAMPAQRGGCAAVPLY